MAVLTFLRTDIAPPFHVCQVGLNKEIVILPYYVFQGSFCAILECNRNTNSN